LVGKEKATHVLSNRFLIFRKLQFLLWQETNVLLNLRRQIYKFYMDLLSLSRFKKEILSKKTIFSWMWELQSWQTILETACPRCINTYVCFPCKWWCSLLVIDSLNSLLKLLKIFTIEIMYYICKLVANFLKRIVWEVTDMIFFF